MENRSEQDRIIQKYLYLSVCLKKEGLFHEDTLFLLPGNIVLNADEVPDREDTSTDREISEHVIRVQQEVQPALGRSDIIAYFTGVRNPTYEEDFVVRKGIFTKNIFEAAGIQSPGLTAAPAIAVDIAMWGQRVS